MEGSITCKTRGGYLYLLWSKKVPAKQYLGSSASEPRRRLGEHRQDIEGGRVEKAVTKHFADTHSTKDDPVFIPFKRVRSSNNLVLRHLETLFINNFNLGQFEERDEGMIVNCWSIICKMLSSWFKPFICRLM